MLGFHIRSKIQVTRIAIKSLTITTGILFLTYTCVPAHNDAKALKSLAAVCFTVPSEEVRRPSTAVCNTQITHWCLSNLHRYCDVKISVNVDNLPYVGLPWHILAGHYPCRQS